MEPPPQNLPAAGLWGQGGMRVPSQSYGISPPSSLAFSSLEMGLKYKLGAAP